jgi:8-oxo-dGTP pyrophosphatase MutT (NUDIX family)
VVATNTILHQAGVIAYRILDGKIQVLLMTSRDTRRWIIPKGDIDAGATPAKAAEKEAYEEAGVKGTITSLLPLGIYTYFKKLESGEARAATVEVYLHSGRTSRTASRPVSISSVNRCYFGPVYRDACSKTSINCGRFSLAANRSKRPTATIANTAILFSRNIT